MESGLYMASLLEKYGWTEWLTHSNYSFLKATSSPKDYIQRAYDLGYQGLGICDYDGLYGAVKAFSAWKKLENYGNLRLLYGAEVHTQGDHDKPLLYQDTIILYALNLRGYQNLCGILSFCHRKSKDRGYIGLTSLLEHPLDNLVAILPMRGALRQNIDMNRRYQKLNDVMPGRIYLAISKHLHPAEDYWISPALMLAKANNIPLLLTQDAFFHHPKNKDLSDLIQAIRQNRTLDQSVPYMFPNSERSLKTLTELEARYRDIPGYEQALINSRKLLEMFNFSLKELRYHYPKEFIPEGSTSHGYLTKITWDYAYKKYPLGVPNKIHQLLVKELKLIKHLEFADYFLTVWDIVRWARSRAILCQGRGSAANSAVCFILGITAVDPTKFDLLFERFISVERGDPPDIDVDFEHERREEVIQHIYQHYGRNRAAMVANVITFRTKGALRYTGKALGIKDEYINLVSNINGKHKRSLKISQLASKENNHSWRLWESLSQRLKGSPRHMGIHSGGFVLTHEEINLFVPQEPATMNNRTIVQWNKDDLEELGFFKIDILALGMLTVIRKTLDDIKNYYHKKITVADIPQNDIETYQMIQRADTVGTFQIESRAQMSMLPRLKPKTFYDIVIQIGIVRPGPIKGGLIHPYLKRRSGLEPIEYAHKNLIPILKRTMGVPIFQEQIMRIAIAIGDFSPGEADQLRKQLGSWSIKTDIGNLVKKLEIGMRKNKIEEYFIKQIIGQLQGFAEYGFPESHAVSFALISYTSAWLKCHYPAAFFTALLNSQPMGFYSRHALIQQAKRSNINILPICINHSDWESRLEPIDPNKTGFSIRLGFNMVKGLRKIGIEDLQRKRATHGGWKSLESMLKHIKIHRGDLTSLAASGALEILNIERRQALWVAEALPLAPFIEEDLKYDFTEETMLDQVERDFNAIGTSLIIHPANLIKRHYWPYKIPPEKISSSSKLNNLPKNLIVTTFGMILVKQSPPTANGMVFVTLEDEEGYINLVFNPKVYQRCQSIINNQGFLCAQGRLQQQEESQSIWVKKLLAPYENEADVLTLEREHNTHPVSEEMVKSRNYI